MSWKTTWLKAFRTSAPTRAMGAPLAQAQVDRVRAWMAGFPPNVMSVAEAALEPGMDTWVVEHDTTLATFRMTARQSASTVFATLEKAGATLGGEGRMLWCLENWNNQGLDDFEAEFLFGQRLAIDAIGQLDRGKDRSRLVVIGRLRVEALGLCFHLGSTDGTALACLAALRQHGLPVATLLVAHDQAQALLRDSEAPFAQQLRGLVDNHLLALGLSVPSQRSQLALADLASEAEPLRKLAPRGEPVSSVCFQDPVGDGVFATLLEAMAAAGLKFDLTPVAAPHQPAASPDLSLDGPYCRAGAYQPMPFDWRIPAGVCAPDGCLEIPRLVLRDFKDDWSRVARWRTKPDIDLLDRLLNFRRMEKYFQEVDASLKLRQTYHEYRVYNRPRPDCSSRCVLVDCGFLDDPRRIRSLLGQVRDLTCSLGGRWRLCHAAHFLARARDEAQQRSPASTSVAVDGQIAAHYYLDTIPMEGPLRQDVIDFIDWLPADLGTVMELGSGFGKMARALLKRCRRYVCVDLDNRMFASMPDELRQHATVADIHALPFEDEVYDSVLANNVLEHSYDPVRCLKEIRRVLKPGGRLFALIPLDALNRDFALSSHLWKADIGNIESAVRMAGMQPVRCDVTDMTALRVDGSFPTCNGLGLKFEASRN